MPLPTRLIFDRICSRKMGIGMASSCCRRYSGSHFVRGLKLTPQTKPIPPVHKSLDQIVRLRVRVKRRRE
jgi:hypothetical protein